MGDRGSTFHPDRYRAPPLRCDCGDHEDQRLIEDQSSGDTVCTACGCVVASHRLESQPEWFDASQARAGPVSVDDIILGNALHGRLTASKYQEPDPHKNVKLGFAHIVNFCATLGISSSHAICVSAKEVYKDFSDARKLASMRLTEDQRLPAAAAALYCGCKVVGIDGAARTMHEISAAVGVSMSECIDMIKAYRALLKDKPYYDKLCRAVRSQDRFRRIIDRLLMPEAKRVTHACEALFEVVEDWGLLEGRKPDTVCAVVIFKACEQFKGTGMTKKLIASACGISPATLEKAIRDWDSRVSEDASHILEDASHILEDATHSS